MRALIKHIMTIGSSLLLVHLKLIAFLQLNLVFAKYQTLKNNNNNNKNNNNLNLLTLSKRSAKQELTPKVT